VSGIIPRPSSTLLLVRDGASGDGPVEVLLLRRSLQVEFVAGAHVFPGGAIDGSDAAPGVESVCVGRGEADASALLGLAEGGLAYWIAAVRECFEEAGILLALDAGGDLISLADPDTAERFADHRSALNRGERALLEVCQKEEVRLATDRIHYFSHWITPEGQHRRYDTRFFVAPAPVEQRSLHDDHETVAHEWLRPTDALTRAERGELLFIRPTKVSLEAIASYSTTAELLAAVRAAEPSVQLANPPARP
jgi:8-oxo-dGTP pyrophosphatase MutT (NUDIX family)